MAQTVWALIVPLTTETKSGVVFSRESVPAVDLTCTLRVFLRFPSLFKINAKQPRVTSLLVIHNTVMCYPHKIALLTNEMWCIYIGWTKKLYLI